MRNFVLILSFLFLSLKLMDLQAEEQIQVKIHTEKFWPSMASFPARYEFKTNPSIFGTEGGGYFIVSGDEAVNAIKDAGWRSGDLITVISIDENNFQIINESRHQSTVNSYIVRVRPPMGGGTDWE